MLSGKTPKRVLASADSVKGGKMATSWEQRLEQIAEGQSRATELDNLIQGYRLYARTEGKSPNTITLTTTALAFLTKFLEANGLPTDATLVGTAELRGFIVHLQERRAWSEHAYIRPRERGLSAHSINCYLRSIRAFWSWLIWEEMVQTNPWTKLKIPKPPRKVVPTFSPLEIHTLLGVIDTSVPQGFRDWTIILALLDTGIRATELTSLKLDDVHLEGGMVKVYGKGGKERMVPIGVRVQRALWRYIQQYRPKPAMPTCGNLFLTRNGKPMTKNRLEALMKDYGLKAGIRGVRCSPHTFRHTFAVTYLRNGGDVFSLQRILGHSSLDVVRLYLNLAEADVNAAHRRYSPVDTMQLRSGGARGKK